MTSPKPVPVRGTQKLVDQMSWVFRRPAITAIEVGWRWVFGVPFLLVCWGRVQHILAALPPDAAGLTSIDSQNPWVAAGELSNVWAHYAPLVGAELRWLAPLAALTWIVISAMGRSLVLKRIEPLAAFRPMAMIALQTVWLLLLATTCWGWLRCVGWAAATHIPVDAEPDLIGYSVWVIFLSLGFFTLWALISWAVSFAPLLVVMENISPVTALMRSLRLGKTLTGKLVEISMVMGIVHLALIVLAMVLSAAPLPFSDQLGDALHVVWAAAAIFYLVATDFFQVVRIRSFLQFWHAFRHSE